MKEKEPILFNEWGQPYRECVLYPKPKNGKRDIKKNWMIRFYVYSIETDSLEKVDLKKYNNIHSHTERLAACKMLMHDINLKLRKGFVFDAKNTGEKGIKKETWSTLFEDFKTYHRTIKKSADSTIRAYDSAIKNVDNFLTKFGYHKMKPEFFDRKKAKQYHEYLAEQEKANGSKHQLYLTVFKIFLDWYYDKKDIEKVNPFSKISVKVKESDKHTPYTDEERRRIWDYLEKTGETQLLLFTQLVFYTFARPHQEVRLIQMRDIKTNTVLIRAADSKNDRQKSPVLPPAAMYTISKYLDGKIYPPDYYLFGRDRMPGPLVIGKYTAYARLKPILKKLGFGSNYTIYGFKHTGNVSLYELTGDIDLVKNQNGHGNAVTTSKYLRKHLSKIDPEKVKHWN